MAIMIGKNHKNVGICVPILIAILIVGLIELIYNPWWWHLIILISTYAIPWLELGQTFQNLKMIEKHMVVAISCAVSQSKTFNI